LSELKEKRGDYDFLKRREEVCLFLLHLLMCITIPLGSKTEQYETKSDIKEGDGRKFVRKLFPLCDETETD
jgi:hypothetical protein